MLKRKAAIAAAIAVAATITLSGCLGDGSDTTALNELKARGFTNPTEISSVGGITEVWAGAPDTKCRFRFTVVLSGPNAGSILLTQGSSSGDPKKDLRIPDPNVPMLKNAANWPQIASCWTTASTK